MAYSHLPYPSNPSLEQLKVIATDTVLWVSTTGSDTNDGLTQATALLTLGRAMDVARQYTIVGKAVLYIRLLRGDYTVTENIDLYHPQGGNIIIEGDPSAFQQRVLWQVENYTWNPENFAGGGHTGSIRLFDGVTTGTGTTAHGFTGQDQGMFFTITNASIGARNGYAGQGITGDVDTYSSLFAGDRFFNHGYSFEEGDGILGVGRILGATTSDRVLNVQFQNFNFDSRCPGLTWGAGNGGIANTISWSGYASNYPEPQYSQPNGYYGDPTWTHRSGTPYPTKTLASGSNAWNSVDPFILSTYPVTIRGDYLSQRGSLFLKNGTLRAIRNIFFAASSQPFTVGSTGVTGATLNNTQAFTAIASQGNRWNSSGTGLYLENAVVGIRHLGFYGMGTAIAAYGSKVNIFIEQSGSTGDVVNSIAGLSRYAVPNTLDNAPVVCTAQCVRGIVAKNSIIDFTDPSTISGNYGADYRMSSSHLSTTGKSVELIGSNLRATSMWIDCAADIPKFLVRIVAPVFNGMAVADGITASFPAYEDSANLWTRYPTIKAFFQPNSSTSEIEIGYINYVKAGTPVPVGTVIQGSTASSTLVGPVHASEFRYYDLYGIKTAPAGLSCMTNNDKNTVLNATPGGTFTFKFYRDRALSGISAQFVVGKTSVLISGAQGVTQGYNAVSGTSASAYLSFATYGGENSWVYGSRADNAISVYDNSTATIEKSLVITNGGYNAVDVRRNSGLLIGELQASPVNDAASVYTSIINSNAGVPEGNLLIRGYHNNGLFVSENSRAAIGAYFVKHPLHGNGTEDNTGSETPAVYVQRQSSVDISKMYAVGAPLGISSGNLLLGTGSLWTSAGLTAFGNKSTRKDETFIRATRGGSLFLSKGTSVFAFDGGTADFRSGTTRNYTLFTVARHGFVTTEGSAASGTNGDTDTRFLTDIRTDRRIMTRSAQANSTRFVYGVYSGTRVWDGTGTSTTVQGYTASGTYIGIAAADGRGYIPPADGVTCHAIISDTAPTGRISI